MLLYITFYTHTFVYMNGCDPGTHASSLQITLNTVFELSGFRLIFYVVQCIEAHIHKTTTSKFKSKASIKIKRSAKSNFETITK